MTEYEPITDEQLHAFVDNQLDASERAVILKAISNDADLTLRVSHIRQDMELLKLAYSDLPMPSSKQNRSRRYGSLSVQRNVSAAIAASVFLVVGIFTGWIVSNTGHDPINTRFTEIKQFDPTRSNKKKIMIHISSFDQKRINSALNMAEKILKHSKDKHRNIELAIVANADGLGVLRSNSTYSARIKNIADGYNNVKFLACGIAMENVRLKEGRTPNLLPQATKIPAALNEILNKLKTGWVYIKS